MSINPISALGGLTASSGSAPTGTLSKSITSGKFSSGSAYKLGGSVTNFAAGLYNSIGQYLISGRSTVARLSSGAADEKRLESLKSIAAKIDAGDIKGGREDALRLLERRANDTTVLRLVAVSHLVEKNYVEAENFYARAAALAPKNAVLRADVTIARTLKKSDQEVLSDARRMMGAPSQRKTALRLLLRLTDRSPNSAEAYLAMADGYTMSRKPVEALVALNEAEKRADASQISEVISRARTLGSRYTKIGLPHNILGRALLKSGKLSEAIKELKSAADLTTTNGKYTIDLADAYVTRAKDKLSRGDINGARPDLNAAQALDPFSSGLAEAVAQSALHDARRDVSLGRYTNALNNLRTAVLKGPSDASFKRKVAALYTSVGAHFRDNNGDSTAFRAFAKAYELDPTSAAAKNNVAILGNKLGLDALSKKSYYTAVDYLEQAYQADKTNTTYQKDLARAYDARGLDRQGDNKLFEALEDFKRAYRLDPTNATIEANLTAALKA